MSEYPNPWIHNHPQLNELQNWIEVYYVFCGLTEGEDQFIYLY